MTGAPRTTDGVHPFRKSLAELRIGDAVVAGPRTITLDDIEAFADLSGDTFYAHMDAGGRRGQPVLRGRVAHGYFVVSMAAGLFVVPRARAGAGQLRPGEPAVHHPVYPGDALTVTLTAKASRPRVDADYGEVTWDAVVINQDGDDRRHLRRADLGGQDLAGSVTTVAGRPCGCPRTSCADGDRPGRGLGHR